MTLPSMTMCCGSRIGAEVLCSLSTQNDMVCMQLVRLEDIMLTRFIHCRSADISVHEIARPLGLNHRPDGFTKGDAG